MTCELCIKRGKNWNGSDPVCYFDNPKSNWNCATINGIRDICYEGNDPIKGVHYEYCDDNKFATINISDIRDGKDNYIGRCLYVAWYKNRGNTQVLYILDDNYEPPSTPTEDELVSIINHFGLNK
jgi:hypothetical protein